MKCRNCNSSNTRVTVTEHHKNETWRYNRCLICGTKFKTIEQYEQLKRGPASNSTWHQKNRDFIRGENNHMAVLTDNNIRRIRLLAERGIKQKDIAKEYGVSPNRISRIVRRLEWTHVYP